jgi:hypothetical protein
MSSATNSTIDQPVPAAEPRADEARGRPMPKRIFVVGCPRSGTTLVQSVLASHTQVTTFTESHFFDKGFRPRLGAYQPQTRLIELFDTFASENPFSDAARFREELVRLRFDEAASEPQSDAIARWFVSFLDKQCLVRDKSAWLEKTPDHVWRVPLIDRVAPGALYVHVLRKPLDTVRSLHKASQAWGRPRPYWYSYLHWLVSFRCSMRYLGRERHYGIFYEDLVTSPDEETRRLLQFLDLPHEADLFARRTENLDSMIGVAEGWKQNTFSDIKAPVSKAEQPLPWHIRLAAATVRCYESTYRKVHAARNHSSR